MPDYEKMYFRLFRAAERAINILIEAQRECEEDYLAGVPPRLVELPRPEPEDTGRE